jgi:hypothetical protein
LTAINTPEYADPTIGVSAANVLLCAEEKQLVEDVIVPDAAYPEVVGKLS